MVTGSRLRGMLGGVALAIAFAASVAWAQSVRPDVGNPLKAAQGLTKSGKHREALTEIAKADAVAGKTAYENLLINQMRGSVAMAAGDNETAMRSFEAVLSAGNVPARDQVRLLTALAGMAYRAKDFPKAIGYANRYRQAGGNDPSMRTILLQSYFLTNECGEASKIVGNGDSRTPTEEELQVLATCYRKQDNVPAFVATLERLNASYPRKEYEEALSRRSKPPGSPGNFGDTGKW